MQRKVYVAKDGETEAIVTEDDVKRLPGGRVQVSGTWIVRGPQAGKRRRSHQRDRPHR